eukprot:4665822-Pleurochrysis_carterae.AAC.5
MGLAGEQGLPGRAGAVVARRVRSRAGKEQRLPRRGEPPRSRGEGGCCGGREAEDWVGQRVGNFPTRRNVHACCRECMRARALACVLACLKRACACVFARPRPRAPAQAKQLRCEHLVPEALLLNACALPRERSLSSVHAQCVLSQCCGECLAFARGRQRQRSRCALVRVSARAENESCLNEPGEQEFERRRREESFELGDKLPADAQQDQVERVGFDEGAGARDGQFRWVGGGMVECAWLPIRVSSVNKSLRGGGRWRGGGGVFCRWAASHSPLSTLSPPLTLVSFACHAQAT